MVQVLIIVVVLSMALTPGLAELGKVAGDFLDAKFPVDSSNVAIPDGQRGTSEAKEEEDMLRKRVCACVRAWVCV